MKKRKIRLIFIFLILLVTGMLFPGKAFSLDTECIVIYPAKYQTAAENLQTFHHNYANPIGTELKTVESIYEEYGDAPLESPASAPVTWSVEAPDEITAHFPTAQPNSVLDILGYIQDTDDNSKGAYEADLQYVVILGNSLDIPPSYYVYSSPPISGYNAWIPTDFFYSIAESGRLVPDYKVGRIPVKDQDDAIDFGEVSAITDSLLTTIDHSTVWTADAWIDYTLKMTTGSGGYYTIEANTLAAVAPAAGTLLVSGGIEQSSATIDTITETILTDTSQTWTAEAYQGYALRIMDTDGADNGGVIDGTLKLYTITDNGTDTITVGVPPVPAQQGAATQDPGALDFTDDTKTWGVDDWAGYALHITSGTMAGKSYEIASNTVDTLTCVAGTTLYGDGVRSGDSYELLIGTFTDAPAVVAGDTYEIYKPGPFLAEGATVAVGNSYEIRDYSDDAIEMVNKIEEWHTAATWAWFQNVTLAAGQRYDTWAYWDEVATVDLINKVDTGGDGRTYLSGMTVNKAFHTDFAVDEGFTEAEIDPHLQDTDTGFLYLAGLGDGDGFHFDAVASEMTAAEIRTYTAADDRIPIVISCANYNAAFDSEIYSNSYPDDFSFGEAIVVSYDDNATEGNLTDDSFGGGIAYIGASRTNSFKYPGRSASTDTGRLTLDWPSGTKTYYMDELLQNVFKQYHRPPDLLGTIFTNAIGDFVNNNLEEGSLDSYEERALYGFTLLGDPALRIPKKPYPIPGPDHAIPTLTALDPRDTVPDYNSMGMPVYEASANRTITVRITTDADTDNVEYKLIDPENDEIHVSWDTALAQEGTIATSGTTPVDQIFDIAYDALNPTRIFCLRVSAQDENLDYTREARLYFQVVKPFTTSTDVLLVDDDQQDIYRFELDPSDETDLVDWYKDALNAAAFLNYIEDTDYVVWDVDEEYGEITRDALDYYNNVNDPDRLVIWFTGDDKGTDVTTIVGDADTADQYYLAEYLDGGGRLFLTGQDIGYDINTSDFFTDYLHATLEQDYIHLQQLDGEADDPVTDIFQSINIAGGGGAENQTSQSEIDPISPAITILTYNPAGGGSGERASTGTAGLRVETAGYKVVYFSFGFEAIDADDEPYTGRYPIMQAVVDWLNGTAASIPPKVTSVSPLNGATGVLITADISAIFTEEMDTSTVTSTSTSFYTTPPTTGDFAWSTTTYTNDTVTFDPDNPEYGETYIVTITADDVTDSDGYYLDGDGDGTAEGSPTDDYTWSFTTESAPDTTPPQVSSVIPTSGTTNASVSTNISAIFSEAMDQASVGTGTVATLPYPGAFSISPFVAGSFSWPGTTMTFDPTNNLAYSTSYTVTITTAATDTAVSPNNLASDYSWSFTTTSAPAVAGTGGGGSSGCFIATSAYSRCTDEHGLKSRISTDDPVAILCRFRDERLLTNPLGRAFVATYYKVSPPVADFIRDKEPLKAMVRAGLRPLVWIAKKTIP